MPVSELLFAGKIPAEFSIVESDVTSVKIPLPYYALLSRMSYLPLETLEVVNHFKGSVIELEQAIWFECDGKPLKSNLPIGVLFDLHASGSALSWKIVIHFRQFPGNKLIRSSTQTDAEKLFSHALKQSVFLLSGNTRLFTSLSILKQTDLHQSILAGDCLLYNDIIQEITSAVTPTSARSLPVAIVVSDGRPVIQRPVAVYAHMEEQTSDSPLTSVRPSIALKVGEKEEEEVDGDFQPKNLSVSDVEKEIEKDLTEEIKETTEREEEDDKLQEEGNTQEKDEEDEVTHTSTATVSTEEVTLKVDSSTNIGTDTNSKRILTTLQDVLSDALASSSISNDNIREVLIQGISLPLDASIYEIWERFCHLDLFLYITVHLTSPPPSSSSSS